MNKFMPVEVTNVELAFGGDINKLLPTYEEIPEEFKSGHNEWCRLVSTWFFRGLKSFDCIPKEDIEKKKAMAHISAILKSFEPKHEHKEAGCAYLLSLWFKEPKYVPANK